VAKYGNRINHPQAQEHLEKILQRYMPHIVPAVAERQNGSDKAEQIQCLPAPSAPQQSRHERKHVCAHSSVNQQALNCVFNFHLLFVIPA